MNIRQIGAEAQEQVVKEMSEKGKLTPMSWSEEAVIK